MAYCLHLANRKQYNKDVGTEKEIEIDLGHKSIKVNARRQGSVYIYSEESTTPVFYQIDAWHEYMHPWYWSKNIYLEAELYSSKITTQANENNDYKNFKASVVIDSVIVIPFQIGSTAYDIKEIIFLLKNSQNANELSISLDDQLIGKIGLSQKKDFLKHVFNFPEKGKRIEPGKHTLKIKLSKSGVELDKIEIIRR